MFKRRDLISKRRRRLPDTRRRLSDMRRCIPKRRCRVFRLGHRRQIRGHSPPYEGNNILDAANGIF